MTNTHMKPSACCDCDVDQTDHFLSWLGWLFFFFLPSIIIQPLFRTAIWLSFTEPSYRIPLFSHGGFPHQQLKPHTEQSAANICQSHKMRSCTVWEESRLTSQSTPVKLMHWTQSLASPDQWCLHLKQYHFLKIISNSIGLIFIAVFVELKFSPLTNRKWNSYHSQCLALNAWWTFGWSEQFSWLILHQEHEEEFND